VTSARALRIAALVGFASTAALVLLGSFGRVDALVVLGAATIVPLGASLSLDRDRNGVESALTRASGMLVAASAITSPFTFVAGRGSIVSASAGALHLLAALVLAIGATRRLAWRGLQPMDELAIDAGSLFLPVGAAFALASRAGVPLGGFDEPVVSFTAAHFHYAGFAAPIVIGAVGRLMHPPGVRTTTGYRIGTSAVVAGVPLTAAGIAGGVTLERASAVLLACGMLVASATSIRAILRLRERPALPRFVLALSFLGLVVPMALAVAFALTGSAGRGGSFSAVVPLATMIRYHGTVNALGFALPALVALVLLEPSPRHRPSGFPMSRLRGGLTIGPEFFARIGALGASRSPTGIVDHLAAYAGPGFDPAAVHDDVRRFYEHTEDYDLAVVPAWSRGFRLGGRIWRSIARLIGQVELPTEATGDETVRSRIVDLRDELDGRSNVRGWVRTYVASGRALYVAAYAATDSFGTALMNIAFPLPAGALVSVLRFAALDRAGGLRVTTVGRSGVLVPDEGIYLVLLGFTLRLPMNEWVDVWPSETPGEVLARHELFLFGVPYLTLDYRITRRRA